MQTLNDNVFGTMQYKHSWCKQDSFLFFDKAYVVQITAKAYKNDGITESQRESYMQYKDFLATHKTQIETMLEAYVKKTTICDDLLDTMLTPNEIIFEKDGSFGVLFEATFDKENGVAVFVKNGEIIVDSQDILL